MRLLRYLILFALVAFGVWPYYHVYRLDVALGSSDPRALEQLVDIPAIRRNYKERLEDNVDFRSRPSLAADNALTWLQQNLQHLGDAALRQAITLEWVRDTLQQATTRATDRRSPHLMGAIDFAFFESYDHFLVRLGELGKDATHIRMTLQDKTWQVTNIIR